MRVIVYVGTPEEIAQAMVLNLGNAVEMPDMPAGRPVPVASAMHSPMHSPGGDTAVAGAVPAPNPAIYGTSTTPASYEVCRLALERRSLSVAMAAALRLIASRHPERATGAEVMGATGYDTAQIAGLFGAFGRRLNSTPGFREGTSFFRYKHDANRWTYGLHDTSLRAVRDILGTV